MYDLTISNGCVFLDEGRIHLSYSTSANQYGSLTWVKYKNVSLPSAYQIRIVFWQLPHKKPWVVVWVSIYNWNCYKSSFSKQGRRGMVNFWEDELELSSLLRCIYIYMKNLIYSRSIRNLSISIVIVSNQLGSWLRDST